LVFSFTSWLHDDGDGDDRRKPVDGAGWRPQKGERVPWYCQAGRRQAGYEALRQCVGTRAAEQGGVGEQGDDGSE
jgi:hypothetical protein